MANANWNRDVASVIIANGSNLPIFLANFISEQLFLWHKILMDVLTSNTIYLWNKFESKKLFTFY